MVWEGCGNEVGMLWDGCANGVGRVWEGCGKGVGRVWEWCERVREGFGKGLGKGKGVGKVWKGCGNGLGMVWEGCGSKGLDCIHLEEEESEPFPVGACLNKIKKSTRSDINVRLYSRSHKDKSSCLITCILE